MEKLGGVDCPMPDPSIYDAANFLIAAAALVLNYLRYKASRTRTPPNIAINPSRESKYPGVKVISISVHNRSSAHLIAKEIRTAFPWRRLLWPEVDYDDGFGMTVTPGLDKPRVRRRDWSHEMSPDKYATARIYIPEGHHRVTIKFQWSDTRKTFTRRIKLP